MNKSEGNYNKEEKKEELLPPFFPETRKTILTTKRNLFSIVLTRSHLRLKIIPNQNQTPTTLPTPPLQSHKSRKAKIQTTQH